MLLVPCFSFQPPKKKNENEFAIRAAALAARRSGARLAPVSPPAALPTILTRNTREKQKNPKNRASSPEDPAQTLPLHGFVLGGRYARLVQQRLGVPQRAARPPPARRRGAGAGGGAQMRRERPAGWPAGPRGGTRDRLGDGERGAFSAPARRFAKGLAFAPRFFSRRRAAARACRRRRGEGRAPFFFFSHRSASKQGFSAPSRIRARSFTETEARPGYPRVVAATNDAPLQSRARLRPKKTPRARRLRAPSETIPRIRRCASFLFLPPIVSAQPSEPRPSKRGRSEGEGPRRRSAAARARRRCSPFFFHWGFRS